MSIRFRGALIVIEGLDRAGKSTQHARLCQNLESQGHRVKRMRFPGAFSPFRSSLQYGLIVEKDRTTSIGKSIDAYLKGESQQEDHVVHLLFSANRWEAATSIRTAIEEGTTVVIDRYYYSGIVYSAAKGRTDLSLQWAREPEIGLPRPDICLFLDISSEEQSERGGFGEEKYETSAMQERVRKLFHKLKLLPDGQDIQVIDAGGDVAGVEKDIMERVDRMMDDTRLAEDLRTILPWSEMDHAPS